MTRRDTLVLTTLLMAGTAGCQPHSAGSGTAVASSSAGVAGPSTGVKVPGKPNPMDLSRDQLKATLKGCGPLIEVCDRVRRGGMRDQAFVDLGILAHHPLEDGEPDREDKINTEDRCDDAKKDLFHESQDPHRPQ